MEINNLDGLNSLLGITQAEVSAVRSGKGPATSSGGAFGSDRATLSSAASEASFSATDSGVRMDKVAAIQTALASGSYGVPASAVAAKIVDSMLNSRQ